MLPDFGWSELLVIAIILIVIVGPKDLPKMLRTFGKTTASLRKMAGDFRRQFDDALKEAELDDVRQLASDMKGLDPRGTIKEALGPLGDVGKDINKELKKAASDIEKSDKASTAKADKPAETPAAVGPGEPEPVNLAAKPAAEPAAKPATTTKKAPAKPAATKSATAKPAASKSAAAKSTTAKGSAPKAAASKATAAKTTSAKKPAAKSTVTKSAAPAKAGDGGAAKPKARATRTKTAAKAAETTGKDES